MWWSFHLDRPWNVKIGVKCWNVYLLYLRAITEMVSNLIWAPDFLGPQEI